jgi:hypothetical protein
MGGKGSKGKPKENERGSSTLSEANLNLFLVPHPVAWNVSFEFPNYFEIFCLIGHSILQCFLPMCIGALIVLTTELGFTVLVAHVMSLLSLLTSIVWENKHYTVFIVWLLEVSFVVLWSPGSALPEPDRRPRWVRRAELKSSRRATKHRRHFIRVRPRPPTLHEQALFHHLDVMHFNLLTFLQEFRAEFCSSHRSPRGARSSEGETGNSYSLHDPGPKRRSRGGPRNHRNRHSRTTHHVLSPSVSLPTSPLSSPKRKFKVGCCVKENSCVKEKYPLSKPPKQIRPPKYTPVPSSCPVHGPGNVSWTRLQHKAAVVQHAFHFDLPSDDQLLRMALQAPLKFQSAIGKEQVSKVIWDSGASISISPSLDDFVGELRPAPPWVRLKGLAKGLTIKGSGHVVWAVMDSKGMLRLLKLPAYHVPQTPVCLLSTTSLLQTYEDETILMEPHQLTLSGAQGEFTRSSVTVRVDPSNNLPTCPIFSYGDSDKGVEALATTISVVSDANLNL